MEGTQSTLEANKKAVVMSVFALGSVLVSYLVYQRVADEENHENKRKRDRMLRKARQRANRSQTRIVGASQQFQRDRDGLTQEEREQLNYERMEQDLQNAATGTKTIYFDGNDNMYTEEEVLNGTVNKKQRNLTKMKVRVPDKDRKHIGEVKSKQTKQCLNDFISQIKQTKSNYVKERHGMGGGKAKSHQFRLGLGSEMTTSSGTVRSLNRIKLEPRHFKSKEGTVWLNMFETISNNYCLGDASSQGMRNRMDLHRYAIPESGKARSSKRVMPRNSSLEHFPIKDQQQRMSRADLHAKEQKEQLQQQRKRITRSTSQEMNMNLNNFE